ncbi:hypothetical protein SGPA1_21250 [Streptomyces misionensis JCM 4497]
MIGSGHSLIVLRLCSRRHPSLPGRHPYAHSTARRPDRRRDRRHRTDLRHGRGDPAGSRGDGPHDHRADRRRHRLHPARDHHPAGPEHRLALPRRPAVRRGQAGHAEPLRLLLRLGRRVPHGFAGQGARRARTCAHRPQPR